MSGLGCLGQESIWLNSCCTTFASQGNRVKVMMKFEGRELQFKEQGKEVLLVSAISVCPESMHLASHRH